MKRAESQHASRKKLLDAALHVIRAKGYSATRVEDVCAVAGLTKGSFFHHFKSKEELAIAAASHFSAAADAAFASAPYQSVEDPLERLLAYIDFRIAILRGSLPEVTCPLGTMAQETYDTYPALLHACDQQMSLHTQQLAQLIAEAKQRHAPNASWRAESLALYVQAVIQGGFVLAKAKNDTEAAAECFRHLRHHFEMLFQKPRAREKGEQSWPKQQTSASRARSTLQRRNKQ